MNILPKVRLGVDPPTQSFLGGRSHRRIAASPTATERPTTMNSSETDFWARVDSEQPREDAAERPKPSRQASAANGSSTHKRGHGQPAPQGASASQRQDAEPDAEVVRPTDSGSSKSKSQRIREYLAEHPEARNRDAVEALASYGVTAADVANVKTQLRKKAEKQKSAKARVHPTAAPSASTAPAPSRTAAAAPAATPAMGAGELAVGEIEAGLAFIENAGGLQRARQIIDLIARIREVKLG